jgi:hypothetical protein
MRSLLTGYAGGFDRRDHRVGHLFQNRYKSIAIVIRPAIPADCGLVPRAPGRGAQTGNVRLNVAVTPHRRGVTPMTTSTSEPERGRAPADLEVQKFRFEQARYRTDILKWIVIAIGAVVSFAVIDYGKLKLEQFRVSADGQRQLLEAYLRATESPQPDVWKRKLHVLENFADDERIRQWAQGELRYIESFAELDTLYRETLRVASQLVEPDRLNDPERIRARVRYNQLYWADLPFARESQAVIKAMIAFRNQLLAAERAPTDKQAWESVNIRLIELSTALRESTPKQSVRPAQQGDAAERSR